MRSLPSAPASWHKWTGIQSTQLKHILQSHGSGVDSDSTPLVPPSPSSPDPPVASSASKADTEAQTSKILQARKNRAVNLSWKRKIYIGATLVICIVLIVVGIVLGIRAYKEREANEKERESYAVRSDQANLLAQGQEVQGAMGVAVSDGHGDEAHEDDDADEEDEDSDESGSHENQTEGTATITALPVASSTLADPTYATTQIDVVKPSTTPRRVSVMTTDPSLVHSNFPELEALLEGNREFFNETEFDSPGLLRALGKGQTPNFAFLGCSDSRVSETKVLGAEIGDLFVTRNIGGAYQRCSGILDFVLTEVETIGNLYVIDSLSTETVFSYAISHLGVEHLIVMGHTKCGAVQAAIVSENKDAISDIGENRIMTWIRPIRTLYSTSTRPEIVTFRDSMSTKESTADDVTSDVWNALVEENVKANVKQLSMDPSVVRSWREWGLAQSGVSSVSTKQTLDEGGGEKTERSGQSEAKDAVELWIHGWVYDVETGLVHDLGISVGPKLVERA
ncbi:hypothetical protein JCM10212_006833 [Sporobolomyces blumeae]